MEASNFPCSISFTVEEFVYVVKYSREPILTIDMMHTKNYYSWKFIFCRETELIELVPKTDRKLTVKMDPEFLFSLFCEYSNDSLGDAYAFVFPKTYESNTDMLDLVLRIRLPSKYEFKDMHIFKLCPVIISHSERCYRKLSAESEEQDRKITELTKKTEILERKIKELEKSTDGELQMVCERLLEKMKRYEATY